MKERNYKKKERKKERKKKERRKEVVEVVVLAVVVVIVAMFVIVMIVVVNSNDSSRYSTSGSVSNDSSDGSSISGGYRSNSINNTSSGRRLRWAGHVARMGESRNAYRVLVGRPEGKRPLGRPRRRWEDNIKMDLREVGYDNTDWINLAQDRDRWRAYVRAAMNLRMDSLHGQLQKEEVLHRPETYRMQGEPELYRQTFTGCSGMLAECFDIRNLWKKLSAIVVVSGNEDEVVARRSRVADPEDNVITSEEETMLQAGYTKWDHKRNEDVMEELQLEPVINHVKHYQNNWINNLHRMHRDRLPKVMLHYRPNGKRSLGRPKKRWIENSTVRS
ncbi:hypothetical protein ANN_15061 [Periplaneta americana]|uniref:Uncharacterized protein n=1 Tax=Periplaneta americana TaxID=6978 RepID=A0ABQ8SY18_PERAM|nr:hypothetical protein ANN_15061 [Periplaneta americana]